MGNIGPAELLLVLIILVPAAVVFLGGPFAIGYFMGKSRGRREATLEHYARQVHGPGAGGGMLGGPAKAAAGDAGDERPRG
jgi:hypothetical protein